MENHESKQLLDIKIPVQNFELSGDLTITANPKGLIIFSHGSGSSRHSSRNKYVAESLVKTGFATLLFDLLTPEEDQNFHKTFDIDLLAERLLTVTKWIRRQDIFRTLPIIYYGASTGAAAALYAASKDLSISGVISRGGRPDLASTELRKVLCPVLLIVGGHDFEVLEYNKFAFEQLPNAELSIVSKATHLFSEPGALDRVIEISSKWLMKDREELRDVRG